MDDRNPGKSIDFDGRGIRIRRLGLVYRSFTWDEIADIRSVWLTEDRRWGRHIELVPKRGRPAVLPFPTSAKTSADPHFDKHLNAVIAEWRDKAGPRAAPGRRAPSSQLPLFPRTSAPAVPVRSKRNTSSVTWPSSRFWHGPVQALLTVVLSGALAISAYDLHRDQAAVDRFHAAKPCTTGQFTAMTGPTQWCEMSGLVSTMPLDRPDAAVPAGFFVDLPVTSTGPDPADIGEVPKPGAYVLAHLTLSTSLMDKLEHGELIPGDQVTVVATVQQVDGTATGIAGSVDRLGETDQTQDSPDVRQNVGLATVLAFAALVLFFGLWSVKSARGRRSLTWTGCQGAAMGLAVCLTLVAAGERDNMDSTSIIPNLIAGLVAAAVCCGGAIAKSVQAQGKPTTFNQLERSILGNGKGRNRWP